ncbi:ComEA family DNA-binding protein [Methylomagnum sp.]
MHKFISGILALVLYAVAPVAFAEALDINTATVEQLDQVMVGVGKAKAQAIVQDREKNGKFKSIDDLVRVKGIGPKAIEKNRDKLTVGEAAPSPQPVPPTNPKPAP